MEKKCTKCLVDKDHSEYRWANKKTGKLQSWCKVCFSAYEKEKWKTSTKRRTKKTGCGLVVINRNTQYVWDYLKNVSCITCGENDPIVLEFDHREPDQKHKAISDMARSGYSLVTIQEEMDKCDVLCANCHRRRTAKQFGWYKNMKV
jgi:hypothetical protein